MSHPCALLSRPLLALALVLAPGSVRAEGECPASAKAGASASRAGRALQVEAQQREEALAAVAAARAAITARAAELRAAQGPEASARWLSGEAQAGGDPRVHLMAAETWLIVPGEADISRERAAGHAREAVAGVESAVARSQVAADEVEGIRNESAGILRVVESRRAAARQARRGRQELIAGSSLLGAAALGVGLMAGGARVRSMERQQPLAGVVPVEPYEGRGSTMIAAGAVLAVGGAILGVTLTAIGARDLRHGRRFGSQRAELQLAPGLGGVTLSGRF